MTSHKIVVLLLLVVGAFSAINISDYLLPEEKNASVTYTNFTLDGTSYSLVKINNVETFLLKDGEIVSNQAQIESLIYLYYVKTYYPTEAEINDLRALIKKFNDSRNDGYDFKGKEEYVCRNDILLSNGKITVSGQPVRCVDNETCQKNALLLFSVYGEGLNLGSASAILGPLMNFTPPSLKMDELLGNYTFRLDNMNESNMADTINYINNTSWELKNLSLQIEASIFRTPRLNDTADRKACTGKCWAICPSFDLDQDAAVQISAKAANLAQKIAPLSDYVSTSALLYNRTVTRLEYLREENLSLYYGNIFRPLNKSGNQTIAQAEVTLKHVQNKTLRNKLDDLKSLHVTIPEDIENHNFASIEENLAEYQRLNSEVDNTSAFLLAKFNETVNAKNLENSLILILESKDLDPVAMKSFILLKNKSADLDVQFRDGLTLAELEVLRGNYTLLAKEAQDLLKSESEMPSTRALLLFRGFSRRVNTGIAHIADKTEIIPRSEIPENPTTLGLFSLLFFLSFSSIALLVFLYVFATTRFTIPKTAHIMLAAFVALVVLLFVFSLMMYLFLGKTSTDATLPEFLADFSTRNSTSIMVDLTGGNVSLSDVEAMRLCASNLATSLSNKNKSWTIYTVTPNTCSVSDSYGVNASLTPAQCTEKVDQADSSFILGYAPKNEAPKFSVIYRNRAEIKANLDYYESCPLTALFS